MNIINTAVRYSRETCGELPKGKGWQIIKVRSAFFTVVMLYRRPFSIATTIPCVLMVLGNVGRRARVSVDVYSLTTDQSSLQTIRLAPLRVYTVDVTCVLKHPSKHACAAYSASPVFGQTNQLQPSHVNLGLRPSM